LAGGCALAFLASAVNTSYLVLVGMSVSHLTGDLSRFAADTLGGGKESTLTALSLGLALTGFVFGAALSGFLIDTQNLTLSRPYGRTVSFIGCLLWVAAKVIGHSPWLAVFLASFALGVQNALASHYRGMILRTTHITGLLTDFGAFVGMKLRGRLIPLWKCVVPALLVFSFFSGAAVGAALSLAFQTSSLFILSGIYLIGGLCWSVIKRMVLRNTPQAKTQTH